MKLVVNPMLTLQILQYLCKKHNFETIFNSYYVLTVQYYIVKGFGYREREFSMRVNAYFGTREQTDHMQHRTMELGNQGLIFIITDRHILP